jgi:hypothetical protein
MAIKSRESGLHNRQKVPCFSICLRKLTQHLKLAVYSCESRLSAAKVGRDIRDLPSGQFLCERIEFVFHGRVVARREKLLAHIANG